MFKTSLMLMITLLVLLTKRVRTLKTPRCPKRRRLSARSKPFQKNCPHRFRMRGLQNINDLACCSERGLSERFDGSIGSATVLFPFGGKYQRTPEAAMAAKIPVASPRETSTASMMSFGFDPFVGEWSAWHGAQTAVLFSLAKRRRYIMSRAP